MGELGGEWFSCNSFLYDLVRGVLVAAGSEERLLGGCLYGLRVWGVYLVD